MLQHVDLSQHTRIKKLKYYPQYILKPLRSCFVAIKKISVYKEEKR